MRSYITSSLYPDTVACVSNDVYYETCLITRTADSAPMIPAPQAVNVSQNQREVQFRAPLTCGAT